MHSPLAARTVALVVTALAHLGWGPAVARGQAPESAVIRVEADWTERDARVSFDSSTTKDARAALAVLEPGDYGRASALLALGASGSFEGREILVRETSAASPELIEREAAVLGLGELGPARLGPARTVLEGLIADPVPEVAGAAMVALLRLDEASALRRVAEMASSGSAQADLARRVLAHARNPRGTEPPPPWERFYELRWEAGRNYGLVDGNVWSASLVAELTRDRRFLGALVLRMAEGLDIPGAKDHLLEILMQGNGMVRIATAVRVMPTELEMLVDSGVWRPASPQEWRTLVNAILTEERHGYFPRTLALALEIEAPEIRTVAAGLLYRRETRFEDILIKALESESPVVRAHAAYVVGVRDLADFVQRLVRLCEDDNPWVAANAMGALIAMESPVGAGKAIDLFGLPPEDRPNYLTQYLFEVLSRAAPDRDVLRFVEEVHGSLGGLDRAFADAILVLNDRPTRTDVLRRKLPVMNPVSSHGVRCASAVGKRRSEEDVRLLARLFPRQAAPAMNLELAVGLARAGHRIPLELLEAAVWTLPLNESVLAAGAVKATYGESVLMSWISNPPPEVVEEDLRRLGYAIGELGGFDAVERLKRELRTVGGEERPEVVGAAFGALASQTR